MTMHLLYIEAINLSQVIDDTQDLATRRAGSQMLLDMVHQVAAKLKDLAPAISTGASKGLFEAPSLPDLQRAKQLTLDILGSPYHNLLHVEVVGTDDLPEPAERFSELTAQLQAEVRRRQACSLTVLLDQPPSDTMLQALQDRHPRMVGKRTPQQVVCRLDQVRPAVLALKGKSRDEPDTPVSWPVAVRRLDGRLLRQKLFKRLLKAEFSAADDDDQDAHAASERFTNDLESLTQDKNTRLNGKMALLYADGNSFGKIAQACKTPDQLRKWDQALQEERKKFLAELLELVRQRRDACGAKALQLEALMWGGDEFLLVLPAALGLQAAQCFFKHCRPSLPEGVSQPQGMPSPLIPSHAVSLVFAHHNSPIEPLQKLAKALAEQGKAGVYKNQDSLNCIVLESFDHAGQDLDGYWQRRGLSTINWRDMTLNPRRLIDLLQAAPEVIPKLPRSGLYKILADAATWASPGPQPPLLARRYQNIQEQFDGQSKAVWQQLWKALQPQSLGQQASEADSSTPQQAHLNAWLMLLELWDYLPGLVGHGAAGATQERTTA